MTEVILLLIHISELKYELYLNQTIIKENYDILSFNGHFFRLSSLSIILKPIGDLRSYQIYFLTLIKI